MIAGLVLVFDFAVIVWLVFFKFRWLAFNIAWGIVCVAVGLHLLIFS
jgi:hypothetical protein